MSNLVDKIQKKSYRSRLIFVWVAVICCMAVIFTLWAINLKSHLAEVAQNNQLQNEEQFTKPLSKIGQTSKLITEKVPSLLDAIKDLFASLFTAITNQANDLEQSAESINQQKISE